MKLDFLEAGLRGLEAKDLLRRPVPVEGPQGAEIVVGGRTFVGFSSNDYLGLAAHPALVAAAKAALDAEGLGAGASRLVTGSLSAHRRLEAALAGLKGTERALLFNSGHNANVGAVPALVGPGDVILSDALNHASIIDGCRLSRAEVRVYRHGDVDDLAANLEAARGARRRLVVTDSVFSMDGDLAPLAELVDLADAHGAMVMVDEAHATGVFGARGAGLAEHLGLSHRIDVQMGTLGKALGAFGAYVAGEARLYDWLWHRARSLVFTTALPPAVCAAAEAAVGLVRDDAAGLRARLWRNVARFKTGLSTLGLDPGTPSQIFPIVVGDARRAVEVSEALEARGILARAIRPPTVPEGTSRLRMTVTAAHTDAHLDAALEALEDVLARPKERGMNDRHARLAEIDRRHVWHPFTQTLEWDAADPLVVEAGEGAWLVDDQGRRYLDGVSSLWVTVHGHRRAELDAAVKDQLGRIAHSTLLGLASVPSIELAERLVDLAPEGLTRVFYSDNGSTAVEVALKVCYQYWHQIGRPEKRRFASLKEAYHGDTIGSVSLGGIDLFHATYKALLFDSVKVDPFDPASLEAAFEQHGHELAAFVLEPLMQGAAGMVAHPKGFLKRVRELCDRHDVLLVADEVATGFGRTGTMFACEQEGVAPDALCLAKGITGGYLPLAVTLFTDRIHAGFTGEGKTFFHGHTYTGNPLACAAALANLELFERERTLEALQPKIAHLGRRLEPIAAHPAVHEIRRRGFMGGVELGPYPDDPKVAHRVCMKVRERELILRNLGNVVVLMPPLCITEAEIDHLTGVLAWAIDEVCGA